MMFSPIKNIIQTSFRDKLEPKVKAIRHSLLIQNEAVGQVISYSQW